MLYSKIEFEGLQRGPEEGMGQNQLATAFWVQKGGRENPWRRFEDEDVELFEMEYRVALLKLKKAAPALNVRPDALLSLTAHEMPMTVCQCGTGLIPAFPWVPFREEFGVCECECDEHVACGACAWLDVDAWRDKWIEWGHPVYTQPAPHGLR